MHAAVAGTPVQWILAAGLSDWLSNTWLGLQIVIGFSVIIFVHELGHFLAAKWMGVRVDRFAVGFFYRLFGYRRGEGFTFGPRPNYTPEEVAEKGYGETDYCLNALPFGGYVKMLGQDDIVINEDTGEIKTSDDPRAFTNKSVGRRMIVVSAGVVFNVLFAIAAFAFVFQFTGESVPAPVLGQLEPGSPPANAGLLPGDRVISVDGKPVRSFMDIAKARLLTDGPVCFRVERDGEVLTKDFIVPPPEAKDGLPSDMLPMITTTLNERQGYALESNEDGPQPGDTITHINGQPVKRGLDVIVALQRSRGAPIEVTAERPDPEHPDHTHTVHYTREATLEFIAADQESNRASLAVDDSKNLLGLRQRQAVQYIDANSPAMQAGFKVGDVVAQWGNIVNPIYSEIVEVITAHDGQPISVVMERDGKPVTLTVTPRSAFQLLGKPTPRVGVVFHAEDAHPIVADVAPDTPAAALNLPRGAELLAIDDHPVNNWFDVLHQLEATAGTTVDVRYRTGDDEAVGQMAVPSSVVNELDLPPTAQIRSINGEETVTLATGRTVRLPSSVAVQRLLEKNIGRTVTVEWVTSVVDLEIESGTFTVRSDNTDPWQQRSAYGYDLLGLTYKTVQLTAQGNVFVALSMGFERTYGELRSVYDMVRAMGRNMFTQRGNVGVQNVSGPIGIVRLALNRAEAGFGELLAFLAFISVNLAVINFLPIPVVDGGLMLFLLLEKIRGKALSLKVQVITTLTGLGLIVLVFVLVTLQDIVRWWGGGF